MGCRLCEGRGIIEKTWSQYVNGGKFQTIFWSRVCPMCKGEVQEDKVSKREKRRQIVEKLRVNMKITVWQKRPNTMVEVKSYLARSLGTIYKVFAFSKVCIPDKWDAEYGIELATKKALAEISRQVMKELESKSTSSVPLICAARILKIENAEVQIEHKEIKNESTSSVPQVRPSSQVVCFPRMLEVRTPLARVDP